MKRVVIVGCGFNGITAAQHLSKLADAQKDLVKITIVDEKDTFFIGGQLQYVMTGRIESVENMKVQLANAKFSSNIERLFNTTVTKVDWKRKTVSVASGNESRELPYDYLLLVPGVMSDPTQIPGLDQGMLNMCNMGHTEEIKRQVHACKGGETILITISTVPYKCPPAPFEYAYLIDAMLREQGVRDECKIILTSPAPQFHFGNEKVRETFVSTCTKKGIEFRMGMVPSKVNVAGKTCVFNAGKKEEQSIKYDLFLGTYPQLAPKVFHEVCNKKGFIPAHYLTMKTEFSDDVFCTGDAAWIDLPSGKVHPKAGAFAEMCARNAAIMIENLVLGKSLEEAQALVPKDRSSMCYAESSLSDAILLNPKLLPDEDGPAGFVVDGPGSEWLASKEQWIENVLSTFFGTD